ncbi:MAG TPA: hypothetical protein VJZ25_00555 [Gemmatimonadaceae bacterium]|nr:hypothetical protein [Gemmatimonadaceae bacterium]
MPGSRKRPEPQVKYIWEKAGVQVWFHYTPMALALQIEKERRYVVSSRPHQRHGHGLFLTTIRPQELSVDELLTRLFALQRPRENVEGVIVVLRDDDLLPVTSAGGRAYVHSANSGAEIDLSLLYLGYGHREDNEEGWVFSRGLYAPRA